MKRLASTISLMVLAGFLCMGQDVVRRAAAWQEERLVFGYSDAALFAVTPYFHSSLPTLSGSMAGFDYRREDKALLPQEGGSLRSGSFEARSFKRMSEDAAVSGSASYIRGVKDGVVWNETSDFTLLYPYVQADSVGGDMQHEQYRIAGSYMHRSGRWTYGLLGGYRALHEWRSVDPRPRNVTSDLEAAASAGFDLGICTIGASAFYRRYHQSQNVAFVNPLGANTFEMHFTGLGSHYGRFSSAGSFTSARYRGDGFGAALYLLPSPEGHAFAGVSYRNVSITRHLTSQNEAPISELGIRTADGFAALRFTSGDWFFGIKADAEYELRQGVEVVVDNQATGSYRDIARLLMVTYRKLDAGLDALVQKTLPDGSISFSPSLLMDSMDASYVFPERKMDLNALCEGLRVNWLHCGERSAFSTSFSFLHRGRSRGGLEIPEEYTDPKIKAAYCGFFDKWSDSYNSIGAGVAFCRKVRGDVALAVKCDIKECFYGSGDKATYAGISAGISF